MKLIGSNNHLAEEHYKNAEETLRVTNLIGNSGLNMWLAIQKYYTEYLATYSLLIKTGITSRLKTISQLSFFYYLIFLVLVYILTLEYYSECIYFAFLRAF